MLRPSTIRSAARVCKRTVSMLPSVSSRPALSLVHSTARYFSSTDDKDSHDDFKPKKKAPVEETGATIHDKIKELVTKNKVVLFMKGTADQPQCGFSYQVVKILYAQGVEFKTANVLASNELREGVKSFSNWPTIPQLYVDGEFVGGCDIVSTMHKEGDLEELFKAKKLL